MDNQKNMSYATETLVQLLTQLTITYSLTLSLLQIFSGLTYDQFPIIRGP